MTEKYEPKVGDVVTAEGQTGIFQVVSLDGSLTQIRPFNVSKHEQFGSTMTHIPRGVLHPFREDATQAAARIVREATEGE